MIVVEGPDCVGKTRLVERLVKETAKLGHACVMKHYGLLPREWRYPDDYFEDVHQRLILDRFIMSEVVYGRVIRSVAQLTPHAYSLVDAAMTAAGCVTVLLYATQTHLDTHFDSGREHFDLSQVSMVNNAYRTIAHQGLNADGFMTCRSPLNYASFGTYRIGWDVKHEVDGRPWPASDDRLVKRIVSLWVARQEGIDRHDISKQAQARDFS